MLTRDVMGVVALAILWVNAMLVAAAAAKQVADRWALRASLARVVEGRVVHGDGPRGALAAQRVEQTGRAAVDAASILFHDRSAAGEIFGGTVELDEGGTERVGSSSPAEVWLTPDALARAGACPSRDAFEQAYAPAAKAKGLARTVTATLAKDARIFLARPSKGGPVVVATMDPRRVLTTQAAIGVAFIVAELLAATACTAAALHPPVFGTVSTVGGALGLAFFLLVQPAGTAVRDAMLLPSRRPLHGRWARNAP